MDNRFLRSSLLGLLATALLTACPDDDVAPDAVADSAQDTDDTSDLGDLAGADVSDVPTGEDGDGGAPDAADAPDASSCETSASATTVRSLADVSGGPLSTARPGDLRLANSHIEVVVQGPGRHIALNPYGGNIIDADIVRDGSGPGVGADVFGELGLFLNLAGTNEATEVVVEHDGADCAEAVVVATGDYVLSDYFNPATGFAILAPGAFDDLDFDVAWPFRLRTEYRLGPDDQAVRIRLTAENVGDAPAPFAPAWVAQGGLVQTFRPGPSAYQLPRIGDAEVLYFVGEAQTYALVPLTTPRVPNRFFAAIVGGYALAQDATLLDVLGFPSSAPQVAPGESASAEALFVVAPDMPAARRIVREALGDPPCVSVDGVVREAGSELPLAGVQVTALAVRSSGSDGDDLASVTSGADGTFTACLDPGPVRWIAGQEGRPYAGGAATPVRVDYTVAEDAAPVALTLPPTGRVRVSVADPDGDPLPARVAIVGIDPSPHDYRLAGDGFDPLPPGISRLVDSATGAFDFALEPGDYDLVVTRGPEYDLHREAFSLAAGETVELDATLTRVVDTAGYLSGDFHVHAQAGPDSTVPNRARVANMAAEGVEVLVSTDHAFVTDYAPLIAELGLDAWMVSLPGQEVTTFDYGHFNLFPLPVDPATPNNGAIDWVGLEPDAIAAYVVGDDPPGIVQVNHPRAIPAPGDTGNYFTSIDLTFDETGPSVGAAAHDPMTLRLTAEAKLLGSRFVAMEIMTWLNVQGLADWSNFLNAGIRFTATGNSDTHTTHVESSGWPRNLVRVPDDDPASFSASDFVGALHGGANTVSFGPFVTLSAEADGGAAAIGETIAPDDAGEVTLTVRVQAPTWAPYDTIRLYEGGAGADATVWTVEPDTIAVGDAARFETTRTLTVAPEADTWYVAIVTGEGSLFPGVPYNESDRGTLTLADLRAGAVVDPATAFAITNPIWVDADDDGLITPSHLVLPPDHTTFRAEDRTDPY